MTKRKIKTSRCNRPTTADLLIRQAERHLEQNPHLRLWAHLPRLAEGFPTLIFALAGIALLLAAFHIVNLAEPAFVAHQATDYAAQRAFYTGSVEPLHAAAQGKIHAAAQATEIARGLNFIGLLLVLGGLWYLHVRHGIFTRNRAGFIVRRIR